ncbi:MAG TPA: FAD-binding oxidoreductase [Vicinamibacterales bacterium]|nr:FAD-binding oxidoreductase [Vicinamibacterales bacterium]
MTTPALRRGQPIWLHGGLTPSQRPYPVLRGGHDADIAIVGGGMTGAMVAQAFVRAGASVAIIEAARVGHGSTAASTALLLQEPDYDLHDLTKKYGARRARRIWELGAAATRDFIDTIRSLRIKCDLLERDSIYYTLGAARAQRLRRELDRRHAAGLGGEWLDRGELRRQSAIDGAGAIRTHGNAQLNPLRACLGLIVAAAKRGALVFERSTVTRIARTRFGVRVHGEHGSVDAARVVIATGYATKYFKPLAGRFKMRRTYVLASHRFSWRERRRLGLGGVLLWDTERPYHYIRWTPDHRLLLGGEDRPVKPGASRDRQFAAAAADLRRYFYERFPSLRDVGLAAAWEGLFAMTPDSLPYIGPHRRYPGHTFALGYGGNGMTFASLAARILVEQWQGIKSEDHDLFAFNRHTKSTK